MDKHSGWSNLDNSSFIFQEACLLHGSIICCQISNQYSQSQLPPSILTNPPRSSLKPTVLYLHGSLLYRHCWLTNLCLWLSITSLLFWGSGYLVQYFDLVIGATSSLGFIKLLILSFVVEKVLLTLKTFIHLNIPKLTQELSRKTIPLTITYLRVEASHKPTQCPMVWVGRHHYYGQMVEKNGR